MGLGLEQRRTRWTLRSVDPQVAALVEGERAPDDGMTQTWAPTLASTAPTGSAQPALQWVAGGGGGIRFASSFVSAHFLDDVRPRLAVLERLARQDPTLGRAPRVQLLWGDREATGFVSSLSVRIGGHWITGLPKAAAFEIAIEPAPDLALDVGPTTTGRPGETQILTLGTGESAETLAGRYLGDPARGDLVRRINPEVCRRPEAAGDRLRVFEASHPAMRLPLAPTSPPFLDAARTGDTWQPVLREIVRTRGTARSRGRTWAQVGGGS